MSEFSKFESIPQIHIEKKKPRFNAHKKPSKFKSLILHKHPSFSKHFFSFILLSTSIYFTMSIFLKKHNIITLQSNISSLTQTLTLSDNEIISKTKNNLTTFHELSQPNNEKIKQLLYQAQYNTEITYQSNQIYENINYEIIETKRNIRLTSEDNESKSQTITSLQSKLTNLKQTFSSKKNSYLKQYTKVFNNEPQHIDENSSSYKAFYTNEYKTKEQNPSVIIENENQYNMLNEWIYRTEPLKYKLLFRSSRDGLIAENFHLLCDDKQIFNNLVIIKSTKDEIFGGYTLGNWGMEKYRYDKGAFLFNLIKGKKYEIKEPEYAVYGGSRFLAVFGNGDLIITAKSGSCFFPVSYKGNSLYELTGGESNFTIKEMEVFNIGLLRKD